MAGEIRGAILANPWEKGWWELKNGAHTGIWAPTRVFSVNE
jgi:hypothetical protein